MTVPNVSRAVLLDQPLPEPLLAAHVEMRRITMGPSVAGGPHRHNSPVFGVIESGSAIFQIGSQPEIVLGPGEAFYEPADELITRFDATDEGVVFVIVLPLQAGQESALTLEPSTD